MRRAACATDPAGLDRALWALFQRCLAEGTSFILAFDGGIWRVRLLASQADPEWLPLAGAAASGAAGRGRGRAHWTAPRAIAVVGPDGSGKTTLIDAALASPLGAQYRFKRFKRYFRRVLFHIRKGQDRNALDERLSWLILPLAWLTFSISRGLVGRWLRPLVLDRYFYDYFVKDARHPSRPLRRIAGYGVWTRLTPRPQRLVVAMCPGAVVHQRKAEVTPANVEALYRVYCEQILRAGVAYTLFCHTGIDPAVSGRQMVDFLRAAQV